MKHAFPDYFLERFSQQLTIFQVNRQNYLHKNRFYHLYIW